jgi:hypothetical protein
LQDDDADPLSSVANLFDAAMCFAVALLIAVALRGAVAPARADGAAAESGEVVPVDASQLAKFRPSSGVLTGEGERLGVAYRLKSGEVVYVPGKE